MPFREVPAPGFRLVSGKRSPPDDGKEYTVQFRNGYVDDKHKYTAKQLVWIHDGGPFDIVAVK